MTSMSGALSARKARTESRLMGYGLPPRAGRARRSMVGSAPRGKHISSVPDRFGEPEEATRSTDHARSAMLRRIYRLSRRTPMNETQTLSQRADALEEKMSQELDYIVIKSRC